MEKSLKLGKIEGRRRRGGHRMRWLDSIPSAMNMNLGKLWKMVRDREPWHTAVHGGHKESRDWATEHQQQASKFWPFLTAKETGKCMLYSRLLSV